MKRIKIQNWRLFLDKKKKITLIDFNNVISKLKSLNFHSENEAGNYHLNIMNDIKEYSNIRFQIKHLKNIQDYCKTNNLDANKIKLFQKQTFMTKKGRVYPLDYTDFNFRVNLKEEKELNMKDILKNDIVKRVNDSKKVFRYLKRFTFKKEGFPFKIDCSIVKSSRLSVRKKMVWEHSLEAANVLKNP